MYTQMQLFLLLTHTHTHTHYLPPVCSAFCKAWLIAQLAVEGKPALPPWVKEKSVCMESLVARAAAFLLFFCLI